MNRLTLDNVTVARGDIAVLAGVSLTLAAGQVLTLRGPNGIGKTTLLRTVAGLQKPVAGAIRMEGAIAYAAHADAVKPTLTVRENLSFWAAVHGGGDVTGALAAFGLSRLATRGAGQLSAGQKRRLGLARLMVTGADIWLLDEPTVSLDSGHTAGFADILRRHCDNGGAALIASHIDIPVEGAVLDLSDHRAPAASWVTEALA